MDFPLGYTPPWPSCSPHKLVCQLHKSIYGLRQASRQWYTKFSTALVATGFTQASFDHSLFTKGSGVSFLALLAYVDDIIIAGPSLDSI